MASIYNSKICLAILLTALALFAAACAASAKNQVYFGRTTPPPGQILRYVSGSEPESLDPQIGTGQPEARLYMSLFEGLVEYDPKTMEPIPAIAEKWEVNHDSTEFTFHLRKNARFSNGDPIKAEDVVYTFRRGLKPELAARNAYLAYYIKYAQGYNEGGVFALNKKTGKFVTEAEVAPPPSTPVAPPPAEPPSTTPAVTSPPSAELPATGENPSLETKFHSFMSEPTRLVLPGDEKGQQETIAKNPKLKALADSLEFIPVKAEDVGVEAVDDYTFRMTLTQSAPFFLGLMPHQFFRVIPRKAIEQYGANWTKLGNIVTSGPFMLKSWKPYNEIDVVRDPMYWDAANVKLDEIRFYPLEDATTMMNLYKAGEVDAIYNHTVPAAWLDDLRHLEDYMDAPEVAIEYYQCNITKPPMNDVRVRKAFNMAIDKKALAEYRRVAKPLTAFSPEGIFPGYPQPKGDPFDPERAKQLLAEAGYKDASGKYDPKKFPIAQVDLTYNTAESNKAVAEFVQAQWKQNLGLTVPLKNMEWKTFLDTRAKLDYSGMSRAGWVGDYMDPYTFLNLFYTPTGDNGTGWWDPKYVAMLDTANRTLDHKARFAKLAEAEAYMLSFQPVIPLLTNATNWMKKPYVKGMYPNPQTLHPWKFVYIEHDQAKWDRGVPDMTPDSEKKVE